ncbi:MAG: anti-sigma factor [Phormidesmis sp.]
MTTNQQKQPLPEEAKMLAADYVLGELTPEEEVRLEQMAADNPGLLQEIYSLQTTLALVPQNLPVVAPPPSLREKIVMSAAANSMASDVAASDVAASAGPSSVTEKSVTGISVVSDATASVNKRSKQSAAKVLAGIAALTALLLGVDNLRLRNQLQIAQKVDPNQVAAILRQPNSRLISLQGTDVITDSGQQAEAAAGTLLFTPGNWQEVIVSLGNLPPLPPGEVYRMWLAMENGKAIYCGEFNAGDDGSVYVRFTPLETPPKGVKTTELFVTIDERGAAPEPSGKRVMQGAI